MILQHSRFSSFIFPTSFQKVLNHLANMPAFAAPTEKASSSPFDSQLPSDNTTSPAADASYTGTNGAVHCNCSSPLTSPTRNASSSIDAWTISLVIFGLVIMAYFLYRAFV